ncbi:substrate-binding domain-containing protein [Salinisphaera japonica]|uniref:Transcriptional regulator n=1 Tax=Salinisphaera japonica YTM-1 TaxID=1209778 RepID=A0A423PYP9_9GAMM|nr:substrate-binding domain-containing protein [Salinisphaera japonica]ROO30658.1 transcriptional regulator [Salinisphaera japonica YTM-1]
MTTKPKTLADIARLAGVSRTTASYVVNGQAGARRISPATVARVEAVIAEHDFSVDIRAAALRRGKTRTLGLIVPDLENTSYARLAKQIERRLREQGYQLVIVDSDDDAATERALVAGLRARKIDGLIVASCLAEHDALYPEIQAAGTPVIALDRPLSATHLRSVASSNQGAARQLTQAVLANRARHAPPGDILWLDAVAELSITRRRRAGFLDAVADQPVGAHTRCGTRYDRATGAGLLRDHLAEHAWPAAIVTAAYPLLDGALDVLLDRHATPTSRAMPQLATFGDHRLLDFLPTTVFTMAQQHEHVAARAVERLLAALAGTIDPGRDRLDRILRQRPPR